MKITKSQQIFKREAHNVYAEEINKIALSSNDDKRLQTFDRITSYPFIFQIIHIEYLYNSSGSGNTNA